jgi:diguanylate cyclase
MLRGEHQSRYGDDRDFMPSNKKPSKLESVSRALRTLSAGNRTLLRASDEQELVRDMCRVIVSRRR